MLADSEHFETAFLPSFRTNQSILSQVRDSNRYPHLAALGDCSLNIRLYRNWVFGRFSPVRALQPVDLPDDFLSEDLRNLHAVLSRIKRDEAAWNELGNALKDLYHGVERVTISHIGEFAQIKMVEDGRSAIPANRLSDGTLRYLCLLAILCDPAPGPLTCIEEPELGLHPDVIPRLAGLLKDASKRTQFVVTTHSADLITALGDMPEAVVVCERGVDGTTLRRLEPERLGKWLERYTLGHLWMKGEIGGNRW